MAREAGGVDVAPCRSGECAGERAAGRRRLTGSTSSVVMPFHVKRPRRSHALGAGRYCDPRMPPCRTARSRRMRRCSPECAPAGGSLPDLSTSARSPTPSAVGSRKTRFSAGGQRAPVPRAPARFQLKSPAWVASHPGFACPNPTWVTSRLGREPWSAPGSARAHAPCARPSTGSTPTAPTAPGADRARRRPCRHFSRFTCNSSKDLAT
jgi:hypothetical protein